MEISYDPTCVQVYRLDGDPMWIPRGKIVFTDRSRGLSRDRCNRKGYIEYEAFDTGLQSTGWNEDIEIGSTVHKGLEALMLGEDVTQAIEAAQDYYMESRPPFDWLPPETDEVIYNDALHLAIALVYAFDRRALPAIREKFEILDAEGEINWLMGMLEDGRYLVMMSRPDGVWRERATSRLWHVSFKTTKAFDQMMIEKLEVDQQKWSEGYAIQAKYGEPVAGTLYYYLMKGRKSEDRSLKVDRWTSGLIRPYLNTQAHGGGEIAPENLIFHSDKRLANLWQRIEIYKEMPFEDYLDYLDGGAILDGEGRVRDFLQEAIAGPSSFDGTDSMAVLWNAVHSERWLKARIEDEVIWMDNVLSVEGPNDRHFDTAFKVMDGEQCFSYRSKCYLFESCWRHKSLEQLIEDGKLKPREANHPVEMED